MERVGRRWARGGRGANTPGLRRIVPPAHPQLRLGAGFGAEVDNSRVASLGLRVQFQGIGLRV